MQPALQRNLALDRHRPRYHFLPSANWMNDPNGLMQFGGTYHMFYQYNPYGAVSATKHWGHAESQDLIHWKHLPIALAPTPGGPDKDGVYSGSGVIHNGVPTLVYTGVHPQVQCIATGSEDMLTWRKYEGNPVIGDSPPGLEVTGFRDPYAWREGDTWYMLVGSGIKDVGGTALLYRSPDLRKWEYVHPIHVGDKSRTGHMWECPSFFPLDGKHVLLVSVLRTVLYFVGTWEGLKFTPQIEGDTDYGQCFYAAQVFRDERGRPIMFGWLREHRSTEEQIAAGWSGAMSLPRIPYLREDGDLGIVPAPEVELLRGQHQQLVDLRIPSDSSRAIPEAHGDCIELAADVDMGDAEAFGLALRRSPDGEEETVLVYNRREEMIGVDRQRSSLDPQVTRDPHAGPLRLADDELLKLRVFVDRSVIEAFANGRACLTTRVYPTRADALGLSLFVRGGTATVKSLDAWGQSFRV